MNSFDTLIVASVLFAIFVVVVVPRLVIAYVRRREKAQRAPRPPGPPQIGEWVRLLVPIPERGLEIGAIGRIRMIYPADDVEYFVQIEGHDGYVMFTREETWQFEMLAGKP